MDSGFRVLDSGFQLSRFRIPKRAGFQNFFCFDAFLRISFSCSNLAISKDVVYNVLHMELASSENHHKPRNINPRFNNYST